uniref:BTB domain-containing protein n=1 Tax=Pavo cristatus TaxID=9049 RepID=A0A8C9F756_PAVCR
MELPSYSKQLLQQLYTLCKEQQFCDCTIFVGAVHFRAHKVVLAAASLLFKSLLDSTDTVSIDASVVTPEEFALLLEMMYTGNLFFPTLLRARIVLSLFRKSFHGETGALVLCCWKGRLCSPERGTRATSVRQSCLCM